MDVTKTVQELLLSKDKDNIIIASEILKTYPLLINTTFYSGAVYGAGQNYGYGRYNGGGKGYGTILVTNHEDYNQGYEYGPVYY
jgi:hypothetical protein